jgi:hypothetical protein
MQVHTGAGWLPSGSEASLPKHAQKEGAPSGLRDEERATCDGISNPDVSIGPMPPAACCGRGQLGCEVPISRPSRARLLIYTLRRRLFRADRQGRAAQTSLVPRGTTKTPWPTGALGAMASVEARSQVS